MAHGVRGTDVWVETPPPREEAVDALNDRNGVLCVGDGKEAEE